MFINYVWCYVLRIKPFSIGSCIFTDGKNLLGFYIIAKNVPSSLSKITSVFSKYDVNILDINFSSGVKEGEEGSLFIVADFSKKNIDANRLLEELKLIDIVSDAEIVREQFPGVLIDSYHFPIVDDKGIRMMLVANYVVDSMFLGVGERFGDVGLAFLYHQGVSIGLYLAEFYKSIGADTLRKGLNLFFIFGFSNGFYRAKIKKFRLSRDKSKIDAVIRFEDMWECEIARKKKCRKAASHFTRGAIAGLVQGYLGREVEVLETKCIAKGEPYCELRVSG